MGNEIVKQPDGLYAVWNTVVDNFTIKNATRKEIIDFYSSSTEETLWIKHLCEEADKPENASNYEHCVKVHEEVYKPRAPIPDPFPKPTPEVQCLRNVSEALYNAWVLAEYHGNEPTDLTEKASQIAYDAYVAVRKLLGDEVK
jgi:hypothetical protein